ncbi:MULTISPECIES: PBSX family phage terminase large subunit [unclassified Corynebacterium]|uniref:PBSX family phage terminase large subunit n=1 Tax=unclassified Corynebacterium TaxID=2624378 RepID=UPI004034DD5F
MPLSEKQLDAYAGSTEFVNIWDGAVRSGKTFAWIMLMLEEIAQFTKKDNKPGGALLIVGKNRDSIYRNVFEPIETVDELELVRPFVKYRQGAATARIFGQRVHVIGANDAGSESRIRGMTAARAWADELTVLHPSFFNQLMNRLSAPGAKMYATTNPDSPGHWLKKEYLDNLDDLPWSYHHFTMADNPALTETYKENMRRSYTGLWYKRFILGLWVSAEGAIYDMWDEDRMVVDPQDIPPIERVLSLGIDYGTTHPTAGQLLGLGTDGRLYVIDEWHPTRATDGALSADLTRWLTQHPDPEWVYVDPAAASFRLQLFEDGYRKLRPADNHVIDGIRTVATLLDTGALRISSTCTGLIKELPGYRWDDKAAEKGDEKPIKENDDYTDALRYAVMSSRWAWSRLIDRQETPA